MIISKNLPFSYIFDKIKFEVIYVLVIGTTSHYLAIPFYDHLPPMPIAIPSFIGTAISVILSFKLSQSYDRWWEARKIWGTIVNESRTFVLQLQSFMPKDSEKEIKELALRHIAWCYSLGQSLRGQNPTENLEKYISEEDISTIKQHSNKHLALLQLNALRIADLKKEGKLETLTLIQLNNTLVNFSNTMGMAERIKGTIFPVTYRLFLHFFIYLFVVTLSIALGDIDTLFELPLLLVISCIFFLLEKSATHLQDPFSNKPTDTPITTITRNIEINIKQLIGETDIPAPLPAKKFYAL